MATFELRRRGDTQALCCRPLERAGFLNAFSLRPGGVSPMPANDLNLAFNEDTPANVEENRHRFLQAAGLPSRAIVTAHQIHGADILEIRQPTEKECDGDALVTQSTELFLAVKTADCVPILIGDPHTGWACGVHAGWRGALARVIQKSIVALRSRGAEASQLLAAIGPAACGACFEVGKDVGEQFADAGYAGAVRLTGGSLRLDLEAVCREQLQTEGLPAKNIFLSGRCTMHEDGLFFSHRREGKLGRPVGRLMAIIGKDK